MPNSELTPSTYDEDSFSHLTLVEPSKVHVKLPNTGADAEGFQISMKNNGTFRLAYKLKGTKLDHFNVSNIYGFIETGNHAEVQVQPKKISMMDYEQFTKADHFSVVIAPVPDDGMVYEESKDVWELEPTKTKQFQVNIEWVVEDPDEKTDNETRMQKKLKEKCDAKDEEETIWGILDDDDKEARVEPKSISFHVPCDGENDDIQKINIINPTKKRITFKVKCTQTKRFNCEPAYGFLDGESRVMFECQPIEFDGDDSYGFSKNDRLSVLLAPAPENEDDAKSIWVHGSKHEPLKPTRKIIPIVYNFTRGKKGGSSSKKRRKKRKK